MNSGTTFVVLTLLLYVASAAFVLVCLGLITAAMLRIARAQQARAAAAELEAKIAKRRFEIEFPGAASPTAPAPRTDLSDDDRFRGGRPPGTPPPTETP